MRTVIFFLIAVALVVLQTTILQLGPIWLRSPDLVFILVSFIAYRFDWLRGLLLVFASGWMMDVVAASFPGLFVFEYLFVFLVLSALAKNSPVKETAFQIPLVGIAYFVIQVMIYGALIMIDSESLPLWSWGRLTRETVIVMVATIPGFALLNALYEYLQQRRTVSRIIHRKSGNRFR
jgi:rod shape-determining protein MreD